MTDTVAFVGAGRMGAPMVARLLDAGVPVLLYARDRLVRDRLRAAGAGVAPTLRELAGGADVVISCLYDDSQLREVALGAEGLMSHMRPGSVFVSHTTGSLEALREVAEAGLARAVSVVDAPVSGTADEIARGALTVILGGGDEAVGKASPLLANYSAQIVRTGAAGSALAVKLVNSLLFAANTRLVVDAVRLGADLGVEQDVLLHAISRSSGASSALHRVLGVGDVDSFVGAVAQYLRKDTAACGALARGAGVDVGLVGQVAEWAAST